jgi:hypothetical protein
MTEYFQIELTQGQIAQVSAEDFEELSKFPWHARWSDFTSGYYAWHSERDLIGQSSKTGMHRHVLNAPNGMQVDHIDGDTLNNRRSNLRLATHTQNQQNKRRYKNNTSGFKGVYWDKQCLKWKALIAVNGKRKLLGLFNTPELAHSAYCAAANEHFGEFARSG